MSILVDHQIIEAMHPRFRSKFKPLVITPLQGPIQSASIDLRLGNSIIVPTPGLLVDPVRGIGPIDKPVEFNRHSLYPRQAILAATLEHVEIPPDMVAKLEGKSTLARLFLQIESAGYVDPGWEGRLTLEIVNLGEYIVVLRPGMLICQIRLEATHDSAVPTRLYGNPELRSHYQSSQTVAGARLGTRAEPPSERPVESGPDSEPEPPADSRYSRRY